MNLSPEQMRFLAEKGLTLDEIIAFASIAPLRSSGAERQARYRARVKEDAEIIDGDVTRDVTNSDVSPSLSRPPNENISNPPTHTHPDNTTRARDQFPKPDWTTEQVWRDLKANRKAKHLPCTATAHAKLLRDIDRMTDDDWPPGRLLEAIVARGWAAAYDPRESKANGRNTNRSGPFGNGYGTSTREIAERILAQQS